ncbi:MAG: hypothetical protein ACK4RN_03555 [Pseudorhodobacter sp.]
MVIYVDWRGFPRIPWSASPDEFWNVSTKGTLNRPEFSGDRQLEERLINGFGFAEMAV